MFSKGNHPQMAARFRLVKYSNLPRYLDITIIIREEWIFGDNGYLDIMDIWQSWQDKAALRKRIALNELKRLFFGLQVQGRSSRFGSENIWTYINIHIYI